LEANEPDLFKWGGSLPFVFGGDHSFRFEPSKIHSGCTTFTQEEYFYGAFRFKMGEGFIARKAGFRETLKGWEGFNEDFKKWCEELKARE
jgi:hypothetical protein